MTTEVMENAALIFWPMLGILIFGTACFVMVLWVFRSGSAEHYRMLETIVLEDAGVTPSSLATPLTTKREG